VINQSRREVLTTLTALAALSAPVARAVAATPADAAQLASLARDIDRVESVRAIKRVEIAWAHYVDVGDWDAAAALFTEDAELAHADDHFIGRPNLRAYFQRMIGKGTVGLPANMVHTPFMMAPIITLSDDGNHAKGRWHAFSMRGALNGDASWQGGIFECEYVRRDGAWKISRQIFSPMLLGAYENGWRPFRPQLPIVPYHFQPGDIGKPFPLGPEVPALPSPGLSVELLAGRIQGLRDEDEIRNLQNAYGYYVDRKMWDDVVDLFSTDGSVEIAGIGTYRGHKGIRRNLERFGPAGLRYGEVNDRIQHDLIIEVAADGEHARARGIELGMIGEDNARAWWTFTRFDNLFVKRDGRWRVQNMRNAMYLKTDYDKGWAKDWQSEVLPSADFAPDDTSDVTLPPLWPLDRKPPAPRPRDGGDIERLRVSLNIAAAYDSAENLNGGYGQYLDDNQWDELASLFAGQGERDSAGGGFIRTPARIASFSRQRYGSYNPQRTSLIMHMLTQPVVHVSADGQRSQARSRLFQTVIVPVDREGGSAAASRGPMFVTGVYENDIVFEDGAWKFKRADVDHLIYAPYSTGWTQISDDGSRRNSPSLGNVADATFDAYNTGDIYPAFPRLPHMWFHYRNPVSGRMPQYLIPKYILPQP